ncbi:DUF6503 family protein [Winogradskyella tangerina]|uniref:DUF6503 family protein n=1 Tax=Winogradskyella tangerina TaxID=2023240 RepID=UPI000DBE685A|nr:DUF6503 family protein [Winogradskyella tangerina]
MKLVFAFLCLCFSSISLAQKITADQLLEKTIAYHDPEGKWTSFNDSFVVEMTTPNAPVRRSDITINLKGEFFSVNAKRDTITTNYTVDKGECKMAYNGVALDSLQAVEKKMSCERAELYKNYYTYLYGLPMKLKDPGTNISETVETKTFKGKDYLVLKVSYDEAVGSDVWYFYFDPKTYAMEVYQFFRSDEDGNEKPDTGEYILLTEEATVSGIKMPKVRAWYYNKDDKYLGTDTLVGN